MFVLFVFVIKIPYSNINIVKNLLLTTIFVKKKAELDEVY